MSKNIGSLANSATAYSERSQASRLVDSWSGETAQEYQAATARLLLEVTALHGREKTINANGSLSPTGQFDQTKIAVQDFIAGLRWLRDLNGTLETKVGNLFGQLFIASIPKSTRSENAQAMRDHEIRIVISALPPEQRNNEYLRASETDQTEVLRAIQDSPMPLILDEVRLRADDERVARREPKRYKAFIENGELLNEVSCILQDCLDLGREFGLEVTPSVDEVGPKIREALEFAISHVGGKGKRVLVTSAKDAGSAD